MRAALVVLADGFEELEAAAPITILRRAGLEVVQAGLEPGPVAGSRGITFVPGAPLDDVADRDFDLVVLPGGMPGTANLRDNRAVARVVRATLDRGGRIGAICAAPTVLAGLGLLAGRRAACHASVEPALREAGVEVAAEAVVVDGPFVTSRGAGTAVSFGLALVRELLGDGAAAEVARGMMIEPLPSRTG
jgi:4-methyl-5(b-hydroxyethyl)-thiazole monophosphate biosynthesis